MVDSIIEHSLPFLFAADFCLSTPPPSQQRIQDLLKVLFRLNNVAAEQFSFSEKTVRRTVLGCHV